MNDGEQLTFDVFMQKMLLKFAYGKVHCVGIGYNCRQLDYLKLINDNMKKFKKYIRKYDIMIVEHNGVLVFFPTRLLNLEKRSKLIEEAKKDLKKLGFTKKDLKKLGYTDTIQSDNISNIEEALSQMFTDVDYFLFKNFRNEVVTNVSINCHGLGQYIEASEIDEIYHSKTDKKKNSFDKIISNSNKYNIICTNNHDGLLPSKYGTEQRGTRQGLVINEIIKQIVKREGSVSLDINGMSYGNALKNYIYPKLHKLFKDYEEQGIKYVNNVNYDIDSPYLPIKTPYTLGRNSLYGNLTKEKLPKNVVINVEPSSRCLDLFHPQWFAKEVKETLMNNPNTRDNMCSDTKIEFFCREIPKTYDEKNPFFKKQNEYICWFANFLKETNDNDVESLDKEKLRIALYKELAVLVDLMKKHKNSRAHVFYKSIFVPTLNKFIEKCGIEGENIADNKTETLELKTYLDKINKELKQINFTELKKSLKGDKGDTLHGIKKGAEILKYAIDNHRHKRGINFTYVYNGIINDMLNNNVSEWKGVQK